MWGKGGPDMDVLTNVLSSMKLAGSVFLEADFSHPWCVTSQMTPEDCSAFFPEPAHVIAYHYVVSGQLLCAVGSEPVVEVRAGQIMLLPRNELHRLGSDFATTPIAARDVVAPPEKNELFRIDWGGG